MSVAVKHTPWTATLAPRCKPLVSGSSMAKVHTAAPLVTERRVNGKFVTSSREWTRPAYHEVSDFFKAGKNLIEVNAEMFGGGSGFIAQFSFGKEKDANTLVTDQNWEVQQDKTWIPAKAFHKYGAGPWKRILDQAIPTKPGQSAFDGPSVRAALVKNDFLMRSLGRPHRDQVVTSRPAELTMLQDEQVSKTCGCSSRLRNFQFGGFKDSDRAGS